MRWARFLLCVFVLIMAMELIGTQTYKVLLIVNITFIYTYNTLPIK